MSALAWLVTGLVILAVAVAIYAALYQRATRETSLVRTGIGGRKIVMDGGTLVLPYLQEVQRVNMQTLRLEVRRAAEAALITKDRMRVDVGAEFHVSVMASAEAIARAAQTLGNRSFSPEKLRELIEGKLIDALRAVAARLSMDELHENRAAFVAEVRESVAASLERNGLALESISLTALDQTPLGSLDENNVFNAVGMRRLAEVIARSKKERAEIDADSEVSVRRAAMQATKRKLEIELEEREAEIAQVQRIEGLKAAQMAEVVKRKAEGELESARARIQMEQEIRAAEIEKEKALREAETARERERAAADLVRVEATRAAEAVATAKQVAEAERRREIALLAARQDAEIAAMRVRMQAASEKEAAADRAMARLEEARADADAMEVRSAARKKDRLAEAEAQRALIDAENKIERHIAAMRLELAKLEALPKIVAEMVKPAEKIESIRIHHLSGLGTQQNQAASKAPLNQALDSIMEMAVQLPALRKIGEDLALNLESGFAAITRGKDGSEKPQEGKKP